MSATVLIIDDDRELCALLCEFLSLEGFLPSAVHHGAEAVTHCRKHRYDVIVLDIMLPGLQGLEVLRQIRQFSTTPILMLTARGEDTDRILGLELGADDYLPKPCNPARTGGQAARDPASRQPSSDVADSATLEAGYIRINPAERDATVWRCRPATDQRRIQCAADAGQ